MRRALLTNADVGVAASALPGCTSGGAASRGEKADASVKDASASEATGDALPAAEAQVAEDSEVDGGSVPFDAGAGVVVLAANQQNPSYIAGDQTSVYWTNYDLGRTFVMKMPLGASP
jgi:hypothetical protein